MQELQGVNAKKVAKYALLPGIIPRINSFIESGFGWLALMMAVVYNSVRLLPNGHPYLNPDNMGKYGIRHVIAEAANNLVISPKNIDQILIFFALLLGFVLLILQCAALLIALIIKPAAAGGLAAFAGLFTTAECVGAGAGCVDIAHMMLDKVFGVPEMFNSSFAPPGNGLGDVPVFNRALQELFQYYSYAILIVGLVIFLYYVVVIVGETANTGTPFGRRFNHIYAPLRLVVAIGLLVPLNYGLNSAQYITLLSAKFGSGFATNSWIIFNEELDGAETPIGTHKESLIARPEPTQVSHIVAFMSIVKTCERAYEAEFPSGANQKQIDPFILRLNRDTGVTQVQPAPPDYATALGFYQNQDVTIRFGNRLITQDEANLGQIEPLCGEINIHTNIAGNEDGSAPLDQRIGAYRIQEAFYNMVMGLWGNGDLVEFAELAVGIYMQIPEIPVCDTDFGDCKQLPSYEWKSEIATGAASPQADYNDAIALAYNEVVSLDGATFYDIPDELLERGWAGAAIWYNHIAEWNGGLFTAAINAPTPGLMPDVMEKMQEQLRSHNEAVNSENRYCPTVEGFHSVTLPEGTIEIAKTLCEVYKYWFTDGRGLPSDLQSSGNVFFDLLNAVFGIGGLFTMRENDTVHPLAQLSALGKSIIESSIRNLLTALIFSAGGGMGEIIGTHLGAALSSISSMFVAFTTVGLGIGFMLYYVLPFMPFMYFFFAVGGWVKTIFEAMVGVPLWALAHLRLDGNGLPGDSASNGYFLIFEIFVRPVLTVFGLIAAMGIFSALARTLNGVFDLVVENLTGFDCSDCSAGAQAGQEYKRNVIDEFFFTIIYTILIYMLATSSFKLIDQIPNSILRWMGAGVQSFGDQRDDPAQGMVQYAAFGGMNIAGQMTGALNQGAKAVGQGIGLPVGLLANRNAGTIAAQGNNLPSGNATIRSK